MNFPDYQSLSDLSFRYFSSVLCRVPAHDDNLTSYSLTEHSARPVGLSMFQLTNRIKSYFTGGLTGAPALLKTRHLSATCPMRRVGRTERICLPGDYQSGIRESAQSFRWRLFRELMRFADLAQPHAPADWNSELAIADLLCKFVQANDPGPAEPILFSRLLPPSPPRSVCPIQKRSSPKHGVRC